MRRVLITDYVHPVLNTGLRDLGLKVHYAPEAEREHLIAWIPGCEGLVINTKTVADAVLMNVGTSLRWIARLGSGLDIIDLKTAEQKHIQIISTPQANANAVAEHVFGMLLCLLRKIHLADRTVRDGQWLRERHRGSEIAGRTVGIIGFGNTGSAFAAKFAGWNVQVIAYDKYKTGYADHLNFIKETTLDEVLSRADILSLHLPLTYETHHLVDQAFIARCRHGMILINSSRGRIVDTGALLNALKEGYLHGACLDVLENERLNTYTSAETETLESLAQMDNVVLTPHIAGWTFESRKRIALQIVNEVSLLQKS